MKFKRETHRGRPSNKSKDYVDFIKQNIIIGEDITYEMVLNETPYPFLQRRIFKGILLDVDDLHAYILNEGKKYHIHLKDVLPNKPIID
jgi:hypothetical protein